jgi:hypothetical protein
VSYTTRAADGFSQESFDKKLSKYNKAINLLQELLESEKYRKLLVHAGRGDTCGLPQVQDKGDFGIALTGRGWGVTSTVHAPLFKELLSDLSKINVSSEKGKLAIWCIDSLFPAFCEGYKLASDLEARRTLIDDAALTLGEMNTALEIDSKASIPSLRNMSLLSEDQLKKLTLDRYEIEALLIYSVNSLTDNTKAQNWAALKIRKQFKEEDEKKALLDLLSRAEVRIAEGNKHKGWPLLIQAIKQLNTSRFYRKVRTQLRPLMGVARMRNWHERWADLYLDKKDRAVYVANCIDRGTFDIKIDKSGGEPVVTDEWIKARLDFEVFPYWTGDFFGSALYNRNGFAGCYILCSEGRKARWAYFDSLTMRLGADQAKERLKQNGVIKNGKAITGIELCRSFVSLHVSPDNGVTLGCAYHNMHYASTKKRLYDKKKEEFRRFPTYGKKYISGEAQTLFLKEMQRFLQGYNFGYTLIKKKDQKKKVGDRKCVVFLPYFFGANNKLASEDDKRNWFLSSKMWSVLHSLGLMRTVPHEDGFREAQDVWTAFWGFEYPVRNRFKSDSDLGGEEVLEMVAKMPLPFFSKKSLDERDEHSLRVLAAIYHGFKDGVEHFGGKPYGFPTMQECIKRTIEFYYSSFSKEIPEDCRIGLQKAICGFLGLSSVEYQFENLQKGYVSTYTKYIARNWNSIRVSGLRDLFGGLYVSSGWKVENSWFEGTREFSGGAERLEAILTAFWPGDSKHSVYVEFSNAPAMEGGGFSFSEDGEGLSDDDGIEESDDFIDVDQGFKRTQV